MIAAAVLVCVALPVNAQPAERRLSEHVAKGPQLRYVYTHEDGWLEPALIRNTLRATRPRLRHCYLNALDDNPLLEGAVQVRMVVGRFGRVLATGRGSSNIEDAAFSSCLVRAFEPLTFPRPLYGLLTVTHTIYFRAVQD